jgi:hypothetical protein
MIEGSGYGSIPLTNGSGSMGLKNMWIRWILIWIRIRNTAINVNFFIYLFCMFAGAPEPAGPDHGHLGGVRHGRAQHSTRHHQRASGGLLTSVTWWLISVGPGGLASVASARASHQFRNSVKRVPSVGIFESIHRH